MLDSKINIAIIIPAIAVTDIPSMNYIFFKALARSGILFLFVMSALITPESNKLMLPVSKANCIVFSSLNFIIKLDAMESFVWFVSAFLITLLLESDKLTMSFFSNTSI